MSGTCPSNSITGFPLQSKQIERFSENDYKAPGIDYETGLVDLQWGQETPRKVTSSGSTKVFLQNAETLTSTIIYGGLKFNLFNVQIVNKTHENFITDKTLTTLNYFYDLFILLKNTDLSFIAFIIPIKEDNTATDPAYFNAAINNGSGSLGSSIPMGKIFLHYDTCFNGSTPTAKRTNLDVFLSTHPIAVKKSTIDIIVGTSPSRPTNLIVGLPPSFGIYSRGTTIGKNELYNYIQTTTFGITNIEDKSARVGIITDKVDEYKCVQLDPDKIDNNTFNIDMINGNVVTDTDLNTIIQERTALKMIMNGEASDGNNITGQERIRKRAAYATALAVIITVICLFYIVYSIAFGKPADTRDKLQYIVAFLSVIFLFTSSMLFLNSDKQSEAQWVGITGGVLSFLYWLFFYALFPVKKECNTPGSATPAAAAAPPADDSGPSSIWSIWSTFTSKWSYSGAIGLFVITVMAFLGGFILGNING